MSPPPGSSPGKTLTTMATSIRSVRSIMPLLDRVLVQRVKGEVKTKSGLYIPEKNVEKMSEGKVLAVGPGVLIDGQRIAPSVTAGDRVLIPPFGGSTVKVGEEDFLLFRDSDILAKIQEE
ncbi:chaperonin 10-like protein [Dipodascopsis tothii]|uniref:chaperonin 10-like protein n=1 Tax=Dipodascopsis tothii TaxID=44089 RepID=UPI0034CDF7DE